MTPCTRVWFTASMDIKCLFITRKGDDGPPEMIEAWDEYSIEENDKGAQEAFDAALAGIGSDLDQFRYIIIGVPDAHIDKAFLPTRINFRSGIGGASK